MTGDGTWTYTYDDEGNMTKKSQGASAETWNYGYDNENHLTSVEKHATDGGTLQLKVEYKYNALSLRIEKKVDSNGDGSWDSTQRYAWEGWNPAKPAPVGAENFDVWADLDGSSSLTSRYLRGDIVDQLLARTDSGTPYWELGDRQGSIRTIIDNNAVIKDSVSYDGWQNATHTNSAFAGRYLGSGREWEAEIALYYDRARFYDPASGRWISQDPLGFDAGDSNLYRYVNNAPTNEVDPSGLATGRPALPLLPAAKGMDVVDLTGIGKAKKQMADDYNLLLPKDKFTLPGMEKLFKPETFSNKDALDYISSQKVRQFEMAQKQMENSVYVVYDDGQKKTSLGCILKTELDQYIGWLENLDRKIFDTRSRFEKCLSIAGNAAMLVRGILSWKSGVGAYLAFRGGEGLIADLFGNGERVTTTLLRNIAGDRVGYAVEFALSLGDLVAGLKAPLPSMGSARLSLGQVSSLRPALAGLGAGAAGAARLTEVSSCA